MFSIHIRISNIYLLFLICISLQFILLNIIADAVPVGAKLDEKQPFFPFGNTLLKKQTPTEPKSSLPSVIPPGKLLQKESSNNLSLLPALGPKVNETEAERAERIHRNFEKMLTLVNIASQVEDYLSSKVRVVARKVSDLVNVNDDEIVSKPRTSSCGHF